MDGFKKLDERLIKSRPMVWILGLHIYIPLILSLAIVLFIIGYINGFEVRFQREAKSFYGMLNLLMTMLSIALTVLYFIRQVRYNTVRIHHHLPFKRFMTVFLAFFMIIAGFSSLPFIANVGAYVKTYQESRSFTSELDDDISEYGFWEHNMNDQQITLHYLKYKRSIFFCCSSSFIKYYSLLALALAMILLGISATSIKDFGWSMLINVLVPIASSILLAISGILGAFDGEGEYVVITIMTLIAVVVGLMAVPRHPNDRSRSFALSFYFYSPILIISYLLTFIGDLDIDDWPVGATYVVVLLVTFVFGMYAKKRAVNPL